MRPRCPASSAAWKSTSTATEKPRSPTGDQFTLYIYNGADGNETLGLEAGTYLVEILEGTEVIGTTDLVLR